MSEKSETAARDAWLLMSDLVLDNERRRDVAEAVGMSFDRARTVRRLARRPMSMRELADALGIDPQNATVVVDDLEAQGFVRRRPHPTDRRAKLVEATPRAKAWPGAPMRSSRPRRRRSPRSTPRTSRRSGGSSRRRSPPANRGRAGATARRARRAGVRRGCGAA